MLTAIMLLNTKKGMVSKVARELGAIDEVTEVYSVAGPYDLIAKIQVEEYERFSAARISLLYSFQAHVAL